MIFKTVRQAVPGVRNVRLTEGGCCWLNGVVSIKKNKEGDGANAGMAALSGHTSMKSVIVVDEDIDIFNDREVSRSPMLPDRPWTRVPTADRHGRSSTTPQSLSVRTSPSTRRQNCSDERGPGDRTSSKPQFSIRSVTCGTTVTFCMSISPFSVRTSTSSEYSR